MGAGGTPELAAIQPLPVMAGIHAKSFAGGLKTLIYKACIRPTPALPVPEAVVIILSATGLADQAHDVPGPVRHVRFEPLAEYLLKLVR